MAETAIPKPLPVNEPSESKSSRKKKSKATTTSSNGVGGDSLSPAVPEAAAKEPSDTAGEATNGSYEHPHIRELQKQIRNINKRLTGLQKTDAIIKDNPGVSLEQLVAHKKINADQKAAAEKKPHLQAQLQSLEEQVTVFKQVDADYQAQMQKLKDDLAKQHEKELEKVKGDTHAQLTQSHAKDLEQKLLVFSQFLRTAAAKRTVEEDASTPENMAFEGALLLVYGGDQKAVETAVSIINGTDEQVPSIEGQPLSFTYSQVRQASIEHAPFQSEEAWVDSVNEANNELAENAAQPGADIVLSGSDPTVANAGLTELEPTSHQPNGVPAEADREAITSPVQASAGDEAGNLAGDRWDTTAAGAAQEGMEDSYEMIPRPNDEVDNPATDGPTLAMDGVQEKTNWADDATAAAEPVSTSNAAAEGWDLKAPGQGEDTAWATAATEGTNPNPQTDALADSTSGDVTPANAAASGQGDDGFQQIPNRHQRGGRGGGRGRGDGEFRGRGRGGRGGYRPDFRGGGMRGSRGGEGYRGDRGDRGGRGGRGRGGAPRGGGDGSAPPRS